MLPSAKILELYSQGLSTRQIAASLAAGKSRVALIVKLGGISRTISEANQLRFPAKSCHWRTKRAMARKVWERNFGAIPKGNHIHHLDGDYTNNSLGNLQMLPGREHIARHTGRGENCIFTKFPDAIILEARNLYDTGEFSQAVLSMRFGISPTHMSRILRRESR